MEGALHPLVAEENRLRPERLGRIQIEGTGHAGHAKEIQSPRIDYGLRDEPCNSDTEDQPGFRLCRRRFIEHIGLGTRHKRIAVRKNRGIRPPW